MKKLPLPIPFSIKFFFLLMGIFFRIPNIYSQAPAKFAQYEIVDQINPTSIAIAKDGRIFLAEKDGKISVIKDDILVKEPVLQLEVDFYNERGVSSILLDPNFELNPYLYIYYTVIGGFNRISRFTIKDDIALPDSEQILMDLNIMVGTVHNGGGMKFGLDGKLYIATGDAGAPYAVQNLDDTWGKVLRLNSDGSIPEDNPFYETAPGKVKATFALGLRNPFSIDIDKKTGQILLNDVGSETHEEINEIVAGKNYGWPITEGTQVGQDIPENYKDPFYSYDHTVGCAIIGSSFYQPEKFSFPELYHNKYFFGDYCNGEIKFIDTETKKLETFITGLQRTVAISFDQEGNMYYLQRGIVDSTEVENTASYNGSLWKVVFTDSEKPNISKHPKSLSVSNEGQAIFKVMASGSSNLSYQWQKNGEDIPDAVTEELLIKNVSLHDDGATFRCIVFNEYGRDTSNIATLEVTENTRPEAFIISPKEGHLYKAGDTLFLSGDAIDMEDGVIPESHFRWWIDFHHDDHTHPGMSAIDHVKEHMHIIGKTGKTEHNVWYRIYFSVRDSGGLYKTVFRDIHPIKSNITIDGNYPGVIFKFEGRTVTLPFTYKSVVGVLNNFEAVPYINIDDNILKFKSWNADLEHSIFKFETSNNDSTIYLNYELIPSGDGKGMQGYYYSIDNIKNTKVLNTIKLDSVLDFNWNDSPPDKNVLSENFLITWNGEIEPRISDDYRFYALTDNNIKVWVDDILIIDESSVRTDDGEFVGSISLEADKKYNIKLEFRKDKEVASIKFLWSNSVEQKHVVPSTQLYPEALTDYEEGNLLEDVIIYPVPVSNHLNMYYTSLSNENLNVYVFSNQGKLIHEYEHRVNQGPVLLELDVTHLNTGLYLLKIMQGNKFIVKPFQKNNE